MLFYSIQGSGYNLEIYQDKIRLVSNSWVSHFKKSENTTWYISDLSDFEISVPKHMFFNGKIQWKTFDGETRDFKFSTSHAMVKKIETYLQKRIIKNHNQRKPGRKRATDQNNLMAA